MYWLLHRHEWGSGGQSYSNLLEDMTILEVTFNPGYPNYQAIANGEGEAAQATMIDESTEWATGVYGELMCDDLSISRVVFKSGETNTTSENHIHGAKWRTFHSRLVPFQNLGGSPTAYTPDPILGTSLSVDYTADTSIEAWTFIEAADENPNLELNIAVPSDNYAIEIPLEEYDNATRGFVYDFTLLWGDSSPA